mmetsp:Transcript_1538/g.4449  ORF Transcript_1538/g.4449 Transcript_1538/m.4449 type:complete len:103 (-) Transcript_1538:455-763(-)
MHSRLASFGEEGISSGAPAKVLSGSSDRQTTASKVTAAAPTMYTRPGCRCLSLEAEGSAAIGVVLCFSRPPARVGSRACLSGLPFIRSRAHSDCLKSWSRHC